MSTSANERQRKRRNKLKRESLKPLLVRGTGGMFDERIIVSLAIKKLVEEGKITKEFINLIVEASETVFSEADLSTRKYIKKIVNHYLIENE